jgi:hypothetical protein
LAQPPGNALPLFPDFPGRYGVARQAVRHPAPDCEMIFALLGLAVRRHLHWMRDDRADFESAGLTTAEHRPRHALYCSRIVEFRSADRMTPNDGEKRAQGFRGWQI